MKVQRKIIEIDEELCDGCGQCVLACAEGAIEIRDGKAKVVADIYCDGLGACLGDCPQGALRIIEREAEEFDPEAVEKFLQSKDETPQKEAEPMARLCPSARVQSFRPPVALKQDGPETRAESALTHWPVQIVLVPPKAPFLKGADLLVAADCTPVAYPNFHSDFLQGKVVMVGCPKFDDQQAYIQKFTDIFSAADIKTVTVVVMEVPCCQGLPAIVRKGMELSGKKVPMEKIVISARGELLSREPMAA